MANTVLVTGGSSGIGLAAALALKQAGCVVYTMSRRDAGGEGFCHIPCDVCDEAAVTAAIDRIAEEAGGLDILLCCAGFGISGAAEFTSAESARAQLNVNLIGTANAARAAIPHMRNSGGGRIVCVSSVAAVVPIPFQSWYSASKAAINSYAQALACEVRPFGISVCAVMPGDTSTGFTDARRKEARGDELYSGAVSRSVGRMERDERGGVPAEKVGAFLARVALKRRVKPLYTVGFKYKLVTMLAAILPGRLKSRVIFELYAK